MAVKHFFELFLQTSLAPGLATTALVFWLPFILVSYLKHQYRERQLLPLPPGPPGLPFLGKLLDVLQASRVGEQHLLFEKWARDYGELYKVRIGPFTQFMVNSDVAVKAIFDKPAGVSANRPTWLVSREHICNNLNVLLINADTPRWKLQRKIIWSNVGSIPRADAGLPFLDFETLKFLHEVSHSREVQLSGKRLWRSIMRYTYSNFATQMFGMDVPNSSDAAIDYIHETGVAQILGTLPGFYVVDVLPWLDHLPEFMKPWEVAGRARFERDFTWSTEKLERQKAAAERLEESLLSKIIEDDKHLGFESKEEGAYFCLMLTIGAADTSQISTWSFLEAMMTYPGVQEKAREEIDKVVGDRIPDFSDYERIPYVRSLVKETWRWRPPVALGHPHITTADITYNGMRVPKGSRICLNGWAVQHDSARHADPDEFCPGRYENDLSNTMQSINASEVDKRDHFAFGAGRRICPGYNVAERSLAVAIMRILWAFEVRPAHDAKVPLKIADWRGPFPGLAGEDMPLNLVPRSTARTALIDQAFEFAETERTLPEHLDS